VHGSQSGIGIASYDLLDDVKRHLLYFVLTLPLLADVKLTKSDTQIDIAIDGKPFSTFFFGPDTMKPYLHPLRAADGTVVSRGYPMETIQGETRDHPHHQGLWFTHGDVNGYDFWANPKASPKHGAVKLDKIVKVESGAKSGAIVADFRWVDPNGKALLRESRRMTFHTDPANRIVDFDITLTALDEPVKFGDTKEGTFALRIHDRLTEKSNGGQLVNASGAKTMKAVWGNASPWVDYSGKLDGKTLGIAIFDHPGNPRHPTTWHARDYGLFAANIFGKRDFTRDKTKDGSLTLEPGKSVRFRYRVVIHPGETADTKIAEMFAQYR
jgi:hypothetical protein